MTKVIIYGEDEKHLPKTRIQFISCLRGDLSIDTNLGNEDKPSNWDEVVYLCRYEDSDLDCMFVRDYEDPSCNAIFFGHFNDGVV